MLSLLTYVCLFFTVLVFPPSLFHPPVLSLPKNRRDLDEEVDISPSLIVFQGLNPRFTVDVFAPHPLETSLDPQNLLMFQSYYVSDYKHQQFFVSEVHVIIVYILTNVIYSVLVKIGKTYRNSMS